MSLQRYSHPVAIRDKSFPRKIQFFSSNLETQMVFSLCIWTLYTSGKSTPLTHWKIAREIPTITSQPLPSVDIDTKTSGIHLKNTKKCTLGPLSLDHGVSSYAALTKKKQKSTRFKYQTSHITHPYLRKIVYTPLQYHRHHPNTNIHFYRKKKSIWIC